MKHYAVICELWNVVQKKQHEIKPVPGQEDSQEGWRVQHERRHGIEDVGVGVDEVFSTNFPAQEEKEWESDVTCVRQ